MRTLRGNLAEVSRILQTIGGIEKLICDADELCGIVLELDGSVADVAEL